MEVRVQKLNKNATLPTFAHRADAGMDLCCVEDINVSAGERTQVRTGIAIAVPEGYVGLVWDKSGISHKSGIKTLGGVIDSGYTGEILVGVYNSDTENHTFKMGEKIAQMLIQRVEHPDIVEVLSLEETERGASGIGSTGK